MCYKKIREGVKKLGDEVPFFGKGEGDPVNKNPRRS